MAFLYNPLTNDYFTAQKGQGAFLNGNQIKVNDTKELKGSIIAFEIAFGRAAFSLFA